MSDKKVPDKTRKKGRLGKADAALWQAMTKDVKRLKGRVYAEPEAQEEAKNTRETPKIREIVIPKPKESAPTKSTAKDVDRRTAERLRKGKMDIDATLDLHGYTRTTGYERLQNFILQSYAAGHRCVLVITGKGRLSAPSMLRQNVPLWLGEGEIAPIVLTAYTAQPHHGGEGALYVLLRRKR